MVSCICVISSDHKWQELYSICLWDWLNSLMIISHCMESTRPCWVLWLFFYSLVPSVEWPLEMKANGSPFPSWTCTHLGDQFWVLYYKESRKVTFHSQGRKIYLWENLELSPKIDDSWSQCCLTWGNNKPKGFKPLKDFNFQDRLVQTMWQFPQDHVSYYTTINRWPRL